MKILTYNIRGLGERARRRHIQYFLLSGESKFCMFQETESRRMNQMILRSLVRNQDWTWVEKSYDGFLGDPLCLWPAGEFIMENLFLGDGFMCVSIRSNNELVHFVNVYSPCSMQGKQNLWEDLLQVRIALCGW